MFARAGNGKSGCYRLSQSRRSPQSKRLRETVGVFPVVAPFSSPADQSRGCRDPRHGRGARHLDARAMGRSQGAAHSASPAMNSRRFIVSPRIRMRRCNCPNSTSGRRPAGLSGRNIWWFVDVRSGFNRVTLAVGRPPSGLPRSADILGVRLHVSKVPRSDMRSNCTQFCTGSGVGHSLSAIDSRNPCNH
jgi:hypothetical protein